MPGLKLRVDLNLNDSGAGSLRQQVLDANASLTATISLQCGQRTTPPGKPAGT
jgi:hypothetical protein